MAVNHAGRSMRMLRVPATPKPVTVLWRWRYEVGATVGVPLIVYGGVDRAGGAVAAVGSVVIAVVAAAVAPVRRWLVARAFCVVTPHRVRAACLEVGLLTLRGRIPRVVLTRCTSYGERVLLWCPAGTTLADVQDAREVLRAACWARDVRVRAASVDWPHIVAVEVVRRGDGTHRPDHANPADGADGAGGADGDGGVGGADGDGGVGGADGDGGAVVAPGRRWQHSEPRLDARRDRHRRWAPTRPLPFGPERPASGEDGRSADPAP